MAGMYTIIPVKDLMTSENVYTEFKRIISEYRVRIKKYINRTLITSSPMTTINQCVTIDVDKMFEYAKTPESIDIPDNYNYIDMAMLFTHFKTVKQFAQHNLIEYVLEDITTEMMKLGYQVTLEYSSSSINNKGEPPISITIRWQHSP
jgi:dihydroneopterin aldolase